MLKPTKMVILLRKICEIEKINNLIFSDTN